MLKILYIDFFDEIKDYLEKSNLTIIAPGPVIADKARPYCLDHAEKITTFSLFTKKILKNLCNKELLRKESIILFLSIIHKRYFNKVSGDFLRIYQLFSELRSSVTDKKVIELFQEDLLEDYNKIILFWDALEGAGFVDEPLAYSLIIENIDKLKLTNELLFIAPDFMSPLQIDFINSLAKKVNVYITFQKGIIKHCIQKDWPLWLTTEDCESKYNDCKSDYTILSSSEMSSFIEDENTLYASKNFSYGDILRIGAYNSNYKQQENSFTGEFIFLKEKITGATFTNENDVETYFEKFTSFSKYFQFFAVSLTFLQFKTNLVIKEIVLDLFSFGEDEVILDEFNLDIIQHVYELRLPRNYLITNNTQSRMYSLDDIIYLKKNEEISIIVTKGNEQLGISDSNIPNTLIDKLEKIGPVKRSGFQRGIYERQIKNLISRNKCKVFIEEGVLEQSSSWKNILHQSKESDLVETKKYSIGEVKSIDQKWTDNRLSASKLQDWIDCKKKFWFQNVLKERKKVEYSDQLMVYEEGLILHDLVHQLINKKKVNKNKIEVYLQDYFLRNKKIISKTLKKIYLKNFVNYIESFNETFMQSFQGSFFESEVNVEKKINDKLIVGRPDLLLDKKIIVEFKRSIYSIPNINKISSFESIQIPVYSFLYPDIKRFIYYPFNDSSKMVTFDKEKLNLNNSKIEKRINDIILEISKERRFKANPKNQSSCLYCSYRYLCEDSLL